MWTVLGYAFWGVGVRVREASQDKNLGIQSDLCVGGVDLDGYHIGPSRKMYIKFVKKDLRIDRGRVLSKTEKHSSCIYSSIKE